MRDMISVLALFVTAICSIHKTAQEKKSNANVRRFADEF
jgi:hypothetical protein